MRREILRTAKRFRDLSQQEILALAITLEEEDGRIYADFADGRSLASSATATWTPHSYRRRSKWSLAASSYSWPAS
jgi:hypothetical protein